MSEVFCGTTQVSFQDYNGYTKNENINVFKIKLSSFNHLVSEFQTYLESDAIAHAEKFHFEKDKNRFIICRAIVKILLAHHLNLKISEIHIKTDINKKPYLLSHKSVHFNLSHAEDMAIIAISKSAVGIDIEFINKEFDFTEVLSYTMGSAETDMILNSNTKLYTFFKFWTRKEAIVKAIGSGISDDLPLIPAIDGRHKINSKLINGYEKLHVFSFDLSEEYVVTIALSEANLNMDVLIVNNLPISLNEIIS